MAKPYKWNKNSRKAANALGLTKAGFLSYKAGNPLHLSERSPSGIRKQAKKLTAEAYAPANKALDDQERRLQGLQAKRDADNQAFANWVASRSDQLRAGAIAAQAAISGRIAEGQKEFGTQLANIRDSANARLQQSGGAHTAGIGGALGAQLDATQAAGAATVQSATNAAQRHTSRNQEMLDATLANNPAVIAAQRAQDFQKSMSELSDLADDRTKLALAQAGDQANAVKQMLQEEITKAQAAIAAQQFGVKEANDLYDAAQGRKTTRQGQKGTQTRWEDTVNKYGYTNAQWKRFSPSHRKRIQKEFEKSGGKKQGPAAGKPGSPQYKKAHSKAISQLREAAQYLDGEIDPPPPREGEEPLRRPAVNKNSVKEGINYLVSVGFHPAVARMAVLKKVYPKLKVNSKTAPKTYRNWEIYIKSLVGSR